MTLPDHPAPGAMTLLFVSGFNHAPCHQCRGLLEMIGVLALGYQIRILNRAGIRVFFAGEAHRVGALKLISGPLLVLGEHEIVGIFHAFFQPR